MQWQGRLLTHCLEYKSAWIQSQELAYFHFLIWQAGYHQVPMRNGDITKTTLATKYGVYEFKTMPLGLCNSPATFQRWMELVLHVLQWQTCLIYLDDVIVYSSTFSEQIRRVEGMLKRISKAGLKLKPSKCYLLRPDVTCLGHIVSGGRDLALS